MPKTAPMADMTREEIEALVARVPESGCPFCGRDPYEYVDIGVGFERVAVSCCDLGIALLQYGDAQLAGEANLRRDLAAALRQTLARNAELEAALRPFAEAFDQAAPTWRDNWGIVGNVIFGDLRRARAALAPTGTASEGERT